MLLLTSTSDKIQLVTASTMTIHVHCDWLDLLAGAVTPGRTNTAPITTATTTDIVASPAASTIRNVQSITIRHQSGVSAEQVTVKHTDGTNNLELFSYLLQPLEHLTYTDGEGWVVYDATGAKKIAGPSVGRFLRTTILSGSGNHTVSNATTQIFVRVQAAGGGGGGCTSVAAAASAAGGGGAGGYAEKTFSVTPGAAYAYVVGTAGAGASGAAGGNGGDSTFAVAGTTVSAKGGAGAVVATALTTLSAYSGGAGGAISTSGDVNSSGQPGDPGLTLIVATPIVAAGNGGSAPFGGGGKALVVVGNGNNAIGFGGGGAGAATGASTVRTGGNGSAGTIIVDEYS